MISPEDSIIIMENYSRDFFRNVFSKMEFIMAVDYLKNFVNKYDVPVLFTERPFKYITGNEEINMFIKKMNERKENSKMPESPMDKKFLSDFERALIPENVVHVKKEDIFYNTNVEDLIRQHKRNTVLLCGFFTETDIFLSSYESYIREFNTYVISDATSTYSERLYFQSLEMISQMVNVIDTRDMEKMF
ncbi:MULTISPECIES: isochorismatase family protein [Acidiplasma]|jgi:isochorismate hydrolase|uniref:Isochorismatase n=2 Tax=Acidiplasma TaxID=507753 RepID=A0A0Q0VR19_9ARCH|nr:MULTISPECIES: isochorismatase family protein [Acidiplasma]KJE48930.1 isochorismatase [Acidiplasma sp. MBA-1]KPV47587.1 isochorismatase [Acidiplasma aeolicum]KQB33578.1 isochorismatase [Acidiplasma cupricumulans]KQB36543.1 isochorismatase [Acidiplasma aeolicum]WMT54346.1 MAG: isochorismatase family protein [Acidiplasma sp.]